MIGTEYNKRWINYRIICFGFSKFVMVNCCQYGFVFLATVLDPAGLPFVDMLVISQLCYGVTGAWGCYKGSILRRVEQHHK